MTTSTSTSTSILEQNYIEPDRPQSQNEFKCNRDKLFRAMRIGTIRAHHKKCDHFYLVKENGRKEKEIVEQNNNDSGSCSVCWKLNKTPRHLKTHAKNLIYSYHTTFYEYPKYMTSEKEFLESSYYKWLYDEFN